MLQQVQQLLSKLFQFCSYQ